ncbi:hypothetical protein MNBD_GAMMA22-119 [hydrothermal vent metagenome]|uniref:Uncharacterized protein n=1 Tax=hydrothermal vent metagenome TaxID=652676 RepID=A0A3B1A8B7_9ZZZZ
MKYDVEFAKKLLGKSILIAVNVIDSNGEIESQQQMHGLIKSVSATEGILILLNGSFLGKQWQMPPDTSSIKIAEAGEYNLKATGEVIKNPDYICSWQVHRNE